MSRCRFKELGDFVNMRYELEVKRKEASAVITMARCGGLWLGREKRSLTVKKELTVTSGKAEMVIEYTVVNENDEELELDFGVEFNFALLGGESPDRYYLAGAARENLGNLSTQVELEACGAFAAVDEWKGVEWWLEFSPDAALWAFPVHTASMSEYGVELIYQCSTVVPHWRFGLGGGDTWRARIVYAPRER